MSRAKERGIVSNPNIFPTLPGVFLSWLGPTRVKLRREGKFPTLIFSKQSWRYFILAGSYMVLWVLWLRREDKYWLLFTMDKLRIIDIKTVNNKKNIAKRGMPN